MNKKYHKAIKIILFLVAFTLIAVGLIGTVFAYTLDPLESMNIYCWNCTTYDVVPVVHINETLGIYCSEGIIECNETIWSFNITNNATCTIHRDLLRGEAISNTNSSCDINVTCDKEKYGEFQNVKYPGILYLDKDNTTVLLNIIIKNFKGEDFWTWGPKIITPDEIISAEYPIDFTCPHEVITEVNMQTCAEYLDPILGEQNPMIYALATGQNDCTNKLSNCTAETIAATHTRQQCEIDLLTITDTNNECHGSVGKLNDEHREEINRLEGDYREYRLGTVTIYWFYLAVILIIGIGITGLYYLTSGGGF